eukprot:240901_1
MSSFSLLLLITYLSISSTAQKYIFVDIIMSANEAEAYCNSTYGTTLASIHNSSDNTAAQTLCVPQANDPKKACSIGLNDKLNERGSDRTLWTWSDGTAYDFATNWRTNEPNDYNGFPNGEDCAVIWQSDGLWNDIPCDGPQNDSSGYFQRFLCNYGTYFPSSAPTSTTTNPSITPTKSPSKSPTITTTIPTNNPSSYPTKNPSKSPSKHPTEFPSITTINPTLIPTVISISPSQFPIALPSQFPTENPTNKPSKIPTDNPIENIIYEST